MKRGHRNVRSLRLLLQSGARFSVGKVKVMNSNEKNRKKSCMEQLENLHFLQTNIDFSYALMQLLAFHGAFCCVGKNHTNSKA